MFMEGKGKKVWFLSGVLLLIFVCTGCSQDLLKLDDQMASDLTVQQLIRLKNRATDPRRAYHNCRSYRMRQSLSVLGAKTKDEFAIEVCFQAPDKLRNTTYRAGKPITVEIFNGGKAWSIDCGTGRIRSISDRLHLQQLSIFTKMVTPSLDAPQIFKKVTADMNKDERGFKTYRLICDAGVEGIAPYVFYINGQTFLEERMETIRYGQDGDELYVAIPADYRWFGNVRLPAVSTVKVMGTTRISKMTHFEMNISFPDYYFKPEIRKGRIQLPPPPAQEKKVVSVKKSGSEKTVLRKQTAAPAKKNLKK